MVTDGDRRPPAVVSVLLLIAATILTAVETTPSLRGPFRHGFLGHNAARYAQCGRNFARHGFLATGLAPDFTPGDPPPRPDDPRLLYLHHPPLAPWVVGAADAMLGESETNAGWQHAVLPFWLLGCCVPLLVFFVARRMLDGIGPGVAALLAAAAPMTGFYGAHVDPQGPLLLVPLLLMTLGALRLGAGERGALPLLLGATVVALLADWPAVVFALLLPVADRWVGGRRLGGRAWLPAVVAVPFVGAFAVWIAALGRSPVDEWLGPARIRLAGELVDAGGAAIRAQLVTAAKNFEALYPWPLLVLAALGAWLVLVRRPHPLRKARFEREPARLVLAAWLATGIAHVVMFPQGALVHDYWTFLLLPPLALAAAACVESARAAIERRSGDGFAFLCSCGVVIAIAWWGHRTTVRLYAERDDPWPARLARALREQTRSTESVLTNAPCNETSTRLVTTPEWTYYSDRRIRGGVRGKGEREKAEREEGPFDAFFYLPTTPAPEIAKELFGEGEGKAVLVEGYRAFVFRGR